MQEVRLDLQKVDVYVLANMAVLVDLELDLVAVAEAEAKMDLKE